MTRAEDKRSEKEYGLASACRDYQAYLAEIHNIETYEHAPIENHRRFVASSMMFHRLERAYCFHMQGRIAERICNESVDLKKYSAEAANVIMRRYSGVYDYLFVPSWAAGKDFKKMVKEWERRSKTKRTKRPRVISNERMDVLDIDFYINHMFCVDGAKISYVESILHGYRRCLVQDLLTFLFTLYPPSEQHSWLEEDFRKASVFYREYYPITEEFLKVKFPAVQRKKRTKDKDFYYFFRGPYDKLSLNKKDPLSKGRKFFISPKNKAIKKKTEQKIEN